MRKPIERIVAFTAIAVVVFWIVIAVAATVTPPDPLSQVSFAPLGVGIGGAVAYYLVYMDGYEAVRERLG